jgi:hypothetical protein
MVVTCPSNHRQEQDHKGRINVMRFRLPVLAALALAACAPDVTTSGAGVGFGSYEEYAARREQELRTGVSVTPLPDAATAAPAGEPLSALDPAATMPAPAAAAAGAQAGSQIEKTPPITPPSNYRPGSTAPIVAEPLPPRSGQGGPNIVQYALNTTNRVGEPLYRRSNPFGESGHERSCARYSSADLAQEAFLAAGGPERDRRNLDPDGDGFACTWSPQPYRNAVR